jgi:GntR family transcriptional regulator
MAVQIMRDGGRIDRGSPLPFYGQLRDILVARLRAGGDWQPGDKLPSEGELCDLYSVSRTVVRQALDELAREGLIHKVKGKVSYVSEQRLDATFVQRAAGFHEDVARAGHTVTSKTLEQKIVPASVRTASQLGLSVGQPVIKLDRLRSVDGHLIQVVRTLMPAQLFPGLEELDLTDRSLYATLDERYGVRPHGGRRTIRAIPATEEDARLLQIKKGSPVLLVESVTWASDKVPFEYFVASYRGDRAQFDIDVVASSGLPQFAPVLGPAS